MPLFFPPHNLAQTAAGVRINGGKLRLYTAGTSNLASVYSDAALSVPLTNPVVADANGIFPPIYAADGTTVDWAYLDASNGAISGLSGEDYVFTGDNGSSIERTLAGGTRFKVSDSGGEVRIEFGDASPDNTGGTGRIGGWANSQADTLELDAAAVKVTGRITEQDKKLPGVVYTEATTFTAASTVDIPLTEDPAGVTAWEILLWGVTTSGTGVNLNARLSFDNGATYLATGQYDHATTSAGAATSLTGALAANSIRLNSACEGTTARLISMRLVVTTVESGNGSTTVLCDMGGYNSGAAAMETSRAYGITNSNSGRATHLRLYPSSGTMTGKYRVVPLRGTGD